MGRLETVRQERTVWKKGNLKKEPSFQVVFSNVFLCFSPPTIVSIIVILINLGIK